jgi:signal transduction histidine kinase
MSPWRVGQRSTGWWLALAAGFALVAIYVGGRRHVGTLDLRAAAFVATTSIGMLVGLWAWAWRPKSRMGPLMFWWPALWLASDLPAAFPDSRLASTVGVALVVFGFIVFAQMALSYPTGSLLPGRLPWVYVYVLGYAAQAIQNAVNLLFWDQSDCAFCPPPTVPTLLHVGDAPFSLATWNDAWLVFVMAILPIGLFVLYRAYATASRATRRSIGPVVATATVITCTSWVYAYALLTDDFGALSTLSWVQIGGGFVAALTALFGLAVTRRGRGSVADLVLDLERVGPGGVRKALSHAVGDPTLELALWLPERRAWSDESGNEVLLPTGSGRAVTAVGDDLAVMIHDPVLLDQPALLEAAGSAARLALENERLHAELRAQLAELRDSRARIVRAGDEERRRLERDLHDGAQQRLLGIGVALRLLRSRVDDNPETQELLDETDAEVQAALRELRELARGIHPAVLADQGLAPALRTLVARTSIDVRVDVADERLEPHLETAIYFVVSEALANVTKHASASRAWVTIARRNGRVVVEVRDDGVGGAELMSGSGLRGMVDRIGALDGRLDVESPPNEGTRLRAEIPCEP